MQAIKYLLPSIFALLMLMHESQSITATDGDVYVKELNELLLNITNDMDREKLANFTLTVASTSMGDVPKELIWENIEIILKKPAIVDVKTDKMEEYKLKLNELVQDYKNCTSKVVPLQKFIEYLDSFGLRVMDRSTSSEEELLVNELIKRIIKPVEAKKEEHYNEMLNLLGKAAEIYLNKLSEEERKREEKMENWLETFKNEKNVNKKSDLVATFFGFFFD